MRANVTNLGDFEEDLFSAGQYEVQVVKAALGETQAGNPRLELEMIIQDGPETDQGDSPQGKKLFDRLNFPHTGMKDRGKFAGITLRKACEAFGVTFDASGFDVDDFIDKDARAVVKLEEYEGEVRPRVSKYLPL